MSSEKDKNVDQIGTYSEHVGEWTTGSGGGAGAEKTHLRPVGQNNSADDDFKNDKRRGDSVEEENSDK